MYIATWDRARTGACPYRMRGTCGDRFAGQNDDAVDVVGHDHKRVHVHAGIMVGHFIPHRLHHAPRIVHVHAPIDDRAEQAFAVLRANRDEIRARLGVIETAHADGTAVVFVRIVSHARCPYTRIWPVINCCNIDWNNGCNAAWRTQPCQDRSAPSHTTPRRSSSA